MFDVIAGPLEFGNPSAVPEPATIAIFGQACLALAYCDGVSAANQRADQTAEAPREVNSCGAFILATIIAEQTSSLF